MRGGAQPRPRAHGRREGGLMRAAAPPSPPPHPPPTHTLFVPQVHQLAEAGGGVHQVSGWGVGQLRRRGGGLCGCDGKRPSRRVSYRMRVLHAATETLSRQRLASFASHVPRLAADGCAPAGPRPVPCGGRAGAPPVDASASPGAAAYPLLRTSDVCKEAFCPSSCLPLEQSAALAPRRARRRRRALHTAPLWLPRRRRVAAAVASRFARKATSSPPPPPPARARSLLLSCPCLCRYRRHSGHGPTHIFFPQ